MTSRNMILFQRGNRLDWHTLSSLCPGPDEFRSMHQRPFYIPVKRKQLRGILFRTAGDPPVHDHDAGRDALRRM
jgi:hypothetical protein